MRRRRPGHGDGARAPQLSPLRRRAPAWRAPRPDGSSRATADHRALSSARPARRGPRPSLISGRRAPAEPDQRAPCGGFPPGFRRAAPAFRVALVAGRRDRGWPNSLPCNPCALSRSECRLHSRAASSPRSECRLRQKTLVKPLSDRDSALGSGFGTRIRRCARRAARTPPGSPSRTTLDRAHRFTGTPTGPRTDCRKTAPIRASVCHPHAGSPFPGKPRAPVIATRRDDSRAKYR